MFGKKKEEEWNYIGDYYNSDNKRKPASGQDETVSGFKPELMEGEQIICIRDGGPGKITTVMDVFEDPQKAGIVQKVAKIVIGLFIAGFIIDFFFFFLFGSIVGLYMMLPFIISNVLIPIIIVGIIAITVIQIYAKRNNGKNYFITDRRIMSFGVDYWQQIPLEDVVGTKASLGKDGYYGNLTVKAIVDQNTHECATYEIPGIADPLNVKNMLDQAIEKCKANQFLD